jgi:hypothetical protein
LKNPSQKKKKGLVEWLKVKALSSNPSTAKKKITGEFIPKRRIVLTQLSHNDITVISSGGPHLFRDEKLKNSI